MRTYNHCVSHSYESSSQHGPSARQSGRILALDVGSRRIGLAVSDSLGITAQPLNTLTRTTKRADLAHIKKLIREHQVTELVLGNPLNMSGEAGTQATKVAAFAEELRTQLDLPIHLWDERLTSAEAHRILDDSGHSKDRLHRKGKVDRIAATLILQAFLQSRSTPSVTLSERREP
jgi:putative Holliday junction resolvase